MNRGAWQATVYGVAELGMTEQLNTHTHTYTAPRPGTATRYPTKLYGNLRLT